MSESVGVVVVTALGLEFKAVCAHLQDVRPDRHPKGLRAKIGTVPGVPWPVGVVQTGEGSARAGILAWTAAEWLVPRALLVVGIATPALANPMELPASSSTLERI